MPSESELRLHRCCFTGHRSEKLRQTEEQVIAALEESIRAAIADGYTTFISGMARGVDIWATKIVLQLRDSRMPITLICASPYDGFETKWKEEWQNRYKTVMDQADLVRFICKGYSRRYFQVRNEWMVDHSSRVIAVYNGEPRGTQNTIEYARQKEIPTFLID